MNRSCTTFLYNLAILLCLAAAPAHAATGRDPDTMALPEIELGVSFDLHAALLRGTARISIPKGQQLMLDFGDLHITAVLISSPGRENLPVDLANGSKLPLDAAEIPRVLLVSYEATVRGDVAGLITSEAIVLTSGWHPQPNRPVRFKLSVNVPKGFTAVSETDIVSAAGPDGWQSFALSQPVTAIHFAAAPYTIKMRTVRPGLHVATYFLAEESALATDYLDAAESFLNRYERQIGPFPYPHYAIVENILPTGFGFPTFTLLGRQVIRLPFIRKTSLGHEILHSWFGNSVDVAPESGNWVEGLTTYLADMAYREDEGDGPAARKEAITSYFSYLRRDTPPLEQFQGAGHDARFNRAVRAVGYTRSALFFHELHRRVGNDSFGRAITGLYRNFQDKAASWDDVRQIFEKESGYALSRFFSERLQRTELPKLAVRNIASSAATGQPAISFTMVQEQDGGPYEVAVPLTVVTTAGPVSVTELLADTETRVSLSLPGQPLHMVIDPAYDLARALSPAEQQPVWSQIMGSGQVTVVLSDKKLGETFAPFLRLAEENGWPTITLAELTDRSALDNQNLVVLGTDTSFTRGLFGPIIHEGPGFFLDVRFHPLRPDQVIALISSSSQAQTEAAVTRLSHYGNATSLSFNNGRLMSRRLAPAADGIDVVVQEPPVGTPRTSFSDFERIINDLAEKRVVYVGETHTSRADHLLQLMIIEALYRRNQKLAIGLEMFPESSQAALDRFIQDRSVSEADFLRSSGYFSNWGYDYRLFRPIFAMARNNQIPLIALNIDREIVSSVYNGGGLASLSEAQQRMIPDDRALDLPGYRQRLASIYAQHGSTDRDTRSLEGFIEAQALWDEGMAAAIHRYLADHPDTGMIVLAGSQHTRIDSGIPPRLARRMEVTQATIGNLATTSLAELQETVDYLLYLAGDDFPQTGKIGITLEEHAVAPEDGLEIIAVAPGSQATAAGLHQGDRIIAIDDATVTTMTDVRIAMIDRMPTDTVVLTVIRAGDKSKTEQVSVTLMPPAAVRPHP